VLVVGVEIVAVGPVVSLPPPPPPPVDAVIVHVKVREALSTPSDACAVTEYVPAVVPVPEMNPVLACTESPGGRPLAL